MISQYSPSSSLSPPPPAEPVLILGPCSVCKFLKKRCHRQCIFAPYFPPTDPNKFHTIHGVFGTSFIKKTLQDLPEQHRVDAVTGTLYEANARIRDPVYGCVGEMSYLRSQVNELQQQLTIIQAPLVNMQSQEGNLVAQAQPKSSNFLGAMDMDIDMEIQRDNVNTNVDKDIDAVASWLLDEMHGDNNKTDVDTT